MYICMYVLSYTQISIDEGLSVPPISYMYVIFYRPSFLLSSRKALRFIGLYKCHCLHTHTIEMPVISRHSYHSVGLFFLVRYVCICICLSVTHFKRAFSKFDYLKVQCARRNGIFTKLYNKMKTMKLWRALCVDLRTNLHQQHLGCCT